MKNSTIKDVAQISGVSVATVSRVINKHPSVSTQVRTLVENAIRELNYELKPSNSRKEIDNCLVGLIIPDIKNPYFPLLMEGITHAAKVHDIDIQLCNVDWDIDAEEYFIDRLIANGARGIIHIPFTKQVVPNTIKLIDRGFPLVFLDREIARDDICSVMSDNEEGAFQAITYLLNIGHKDIVYINGPSHFSTTVARTAGYRRGLMEMGHEPREEMILEGDTSFESAFEQISLFAEKHVPFSAIFASNDLMALGAWRALEEHGMRVPEDVSIVGYDDIPSAFITSLTTIAQPSYETGRNALTLLLDLIRGRRKPPYKIVLRDSLIIRKSCKKI